MTILLYPGASAAHLFPAGPLCGQRIESQRKAAYDDLLPAAGTKTNTAQAAVQNCHTEGCQYYANGIHTDCTRKDTHVRGNNVGEQRVRSGQTSLRRHHVVRTENRTGTA